MRPIDADALLKHKCDCYDANGHLLYAVPTGYIQIAPTIGGWISVKHRLPETSGTYLVLTESGDAFSAEHDTCIDDPDKSWGWWREYFDGETLGCMGSEFEPVYGITHWMPMPELPKEDNDEY